MGMVLEFRQYDEFDNVFVCPVYNSREDYTMNDYVEYVLKLEVRGVKFY